MIDCQLSNIQATQIQEICSFGHKDQANQWISHSERCQNIDSHVIILEYLSLPVSPTTSQQCALHCRGISVAYHC